MEWPEYRNKICAVVSGGLFTLGWWLAIDASVSDHANTRDLYHLCGVFGALSMFMVNTVSNGHLTGESLYTDGILGGVAIRLPDGAYLRSALARGGCMLLAGPTFIGVL